MPPLIAPPPEPTLSFDDNDGCQMVAPHDGNLAWLLLLPWRRRFRCAFSRACGRGKG